MMHVNSVLPLDKQHITDSSGHVVPSLDERWISCRRFVIYVALPYDEDDEEAHGLWLVRVKYIIADLHWLLQLGHQRFWCQTIFDESLRRLLDSLLRYFPRPFDWASEAANRHCSELEQLNRLIFFTFVRLSTYEESKECWITPDVYADVIYDNFLFDVPKLFDLCALYGRANQRLLSKMVDNVFTLQPKYVADLQDSLPTVIQAFQNLVAEFQLEQTSKDGLLLDMNHCQGRSEMTLLRLTESLCYAADCVITLFALLDVYPLAAGVFFSERFLILLAQTYENLIPVSIVAMRALRCEGRSDKRFLRAKLEQTRTYLLKSFHRIISHVCLKPAFSLLTKETGDTDVAKQNASHAMEEFISIMTAVLSEKRFLADYDAMFCFQDDVNVFSQVVGINRDTHTAFIQDAIDSASTVYASRRPPSARNSGSASHADSTARSCANRSGTISESVSRPGVCGAVCEAGPLLTLDKLRQTNGSVVDTGPREPTCTVSARELDALVSAVKDLLPHLGSSFIQLALCQLDYNVERVVNAVLEDELPLALRNVDPSLESGEGVGLPATTEECNSRRNIFDYDKFDVFHNLDVDLNNVHIGKRRKDDDVRLGDSTAVTGLKPMYDVYGSVDVDSMYDQHLYDDEYDDTYDVSNVGAHDDDSVDDLLTLCRPFTEPQVPLKGTSLCTVLEANGSSEEEESSTEDHFVEDPAKVRQQRENGGTLTGHHNPNVRGGSKGQGHSDTVLHNRRLKNQKKATRANHNRRLMSDRKMQRGMF